MNDETGLIVPEYDPSSDNELQAAYPTIVLSPTIDSSTNGNDDAAIPCSDWKGCAASLGFLFVAGLFGFVCAMAGYRYGNDACTNSSKSH